MEHGSGLPILWKAGSYKEVDTEGLKGLWFKTLSWKGGEKFIQLNVIAYTYDDALGPQANTKDCLELDLHLAKDPWTRLEMVYEEIKGSISQMKFHVEPEVTLIDVRTMWEETPRLDVRVNAESKEKRIYPTLSSIKSSDQERQVDVKDLLFRKSLPDLAMLVSVREKVVIGKKTLLPEMIFVLKIVHNQDQDEDKKMKEENFNLSKFKSERDALVEHGGKNNVIEFVADVVHEKKEIMGYLMEYAENGSLLNYFEMTDPEEISTDDTRKWVRQLFDGLASLHGKNYVVATIHPSTCLIDGNRNLKLAGLGRKRIKSDMPLSMALWDALQQEKRLVPLATKETDLYMAGVLSCMILSKSTKLGVPKLEAMAKYCPRRWLGCLLVCLSDQGISALRCAELLKKPEE